MQAALKARGLPPSALRRCGWRTRPWEDSIARGYHLTKGAVALPSVTGLIYDSIPTAMAGLRAIHELGRCPAKTYGLVVNSDYFTLERYLWPPVSVVASGLHDLVSRAFEIILANGAGMPRHTPIAVNVTTSLVTPGPVHASRNASA